MSIQQFFKRYGTETTTNTQLLEWGKELHIPNLHYVMKDELFSLNRSVVNILINYDTSDKGGTHHCAVFNHPNYPAYFDSYGGSPLPEVVKFMNANGKAITSDFPIQPRNASFCGQVSLFVLYKLNQNPESYCNIILELNNNINGKQNTRR